jgi:hypothetical protein
LTFIREKVSVTKNGRNDFGKYDYYQLDDIYAAVKILFKEYGIFTTFNQEPCGKTTVFSVANDKTGAGNKKTISLPMVKSILTVYDTESTESFTFSNMSMMNDGKGMQPAQNAGANVTYQSKYAYSTLLMLDDGALDPDAHKPAKKTKKSKPETDNFDL